MREIKFRAWDKENGMVYEPAFGFMSSGQINLNSFFTQPEPIIMQYTGLKDKNGKEIYEGDIIKTSIKRSPMEVVWQEHNACFRPFNSNGFTLADGQGYEIIGNIYENSNLLK